MLAGCIAGGFASMGSVSVFSKALGLEGSRTASILSKSVTTSRNGNQRTNILGTILSPAFIQLL